MKQRFIIFTVISPIVLSLFLSSCNSKPVPPSANSALSELSALSEKEASDYISRLSRTDPISPYYKDPATQKETLAFFSGLTQSENVARVILENAGRFGVRPSLAFALALEESEFRVDAINRNGDSIDRGLFQLNSKSYPRLKTTEFYDPAINARYGIAHLASCISQAGNEVAALAMYNAGNGRVERGATPKRTLDYVSRILSYEDNIASLFAAKVMTASRPVPGLARLVAEGVSLGLVSNAVAGRQP